MMNQYFSQFRGFDGDFGPMGAQDVVWGLHMAPFVAGIGIIMALLALWSIVWKVLALWRAARQGSKWWFVILMVVNTLGLLEILYLFVFSKKKSIRDMMKPAKAISASPSDEEKKAEVI